MTQTISLSAQLRERAGKGTARATRREGRVPAVIYGGNQPPLMISLELREFRKNYTATFFTHLFDIQIDGKAHRVLPRDVQLHPVTDVPEHVDFLRVSAKTKIAVEVPVEFVNQDKSPGLKRGGVLNIVRHTVELNVAAESIPEHVTVDMTGLDINDSVHISAVQLPKGAVPTIDRDFTIATVAAPSAVRSAAAAGGGEEAETEAEEA